jgi:D-erythrulose 1-phosphate 3-epimerase
MTTFTLGVNTCFAVKRWPEPERWAEIVRERVGVDLVQHSMDLVRLDGSAGLRSRQAESIRLACERRGLLLHSTFTGLAAYSSNMLLDPVPEVRTWAEEWWRRAIAFTALVGARATGGHVGAFTVTDWRDDRRRMERWDNLRAGLDRLAVAAREAGLDALYVENLAAAREPSTMAQIESLLTEGDRDRVPIALCLDVGHQCVSGTSGEERDPYAWLERFGSRAPVVQLQQSDAAADHHWPFTPEKNALGRIDPDRVLTSLAASGAENVALVLEIIPPFEEDDDRVIDDLAVSAELWRDALQRHREAGSLS